MSGPAPATSDVVRIQYAGKLEKAVVTFKHDAPYQDAKLIVESLTY